MSDPIIRGMFTALVRDAGGVDAAAAVLNIGKGTVSKMCAGHIGVTIESTLQLEDFVGRWPLTSWLAGRQRATSKGTRDLQSKAADFMLATGAASAALVGAMCPSSPGGTRITEKERADVIVTLRLVQDCVTQAITAAEQAGEST